MNLGMTIESINSNKYFYGIMMILLNMGSKYIEMDLVNDHRNFLSSKLLRRLAIFTMAFIATRDIVASLIITASFIIIVLNLFNTASEYCILSKNITENNNTVTDTITEEQIKNAYDILKKAGKLNDFNQD